MRWYVWSNRLPDGERITSAGMRYSNIDPDQETSADPQSTGVKRATEFEPMRRRDIALRNGDEAGEPRLRRQQIVTTRVETVIGDAIPDREELPRRVEEKAKLHGVEHRLRELGEGRKATDQRSGGCGSTREALDEGVDVRKGVAAGGTLGRQARAERRECAYGGLTALRRVGQSRECGKARRDRRPRQPCSGGGVIGECVPTDKPGPGKRQVKVARVTRDARLHGLRPGEHLCIGTVIPLRSQRARDVHHGMRVGSRVPSGARPNPLASRGPD